MAAADYRLMTEATGQRIAIALENLAGFGAYLTTADVVNNLTSTATNAPLAAAQGKALNDKINQLLMQLNSTGNFTSSTSYSYTGVSVTIPSNSYFAVLCKANYISHAPLGVVLSTSSTSIDNPRVMARNDEGMACSVCGYTVQSITLYLWAKYQAESANTATIAGWYMQ